MQEVSARIVAVAKTMEMLTGALDDLGQVFGLRWCELRLAGSESPDGTDIALPLVVGGETVGVLVASLQDAAVLDAQREIWLRILAHQVAARVQGLLAEGRTVSPKDVPAEDGPVDRAQRRFTFFREAETVFVDDEYLVRNVPARILWKILSLDASTGRRTWTNRELRLDRSLGLPAYRDNLESRLILLRKRLLERCPEVRLVPIRRGRFVLETDSRIELEER